MSRLLYRIGGATAAHPWRTITAWIAILLTTVGLAVAFGGEPHDDYNVPGTSSQRGTDLLEDRFPETSGADARVVVHAEDGGSLDPALLSEIGSRLSQVDGGGVVSPPRMSPDGDTALFSMLYRVPVTDFSGTDGLDALERAAQPAADAGLQVEFGGMVPENVREISGTAELVGVAVALAILLFAFGSVVAAGLPLAVAAVGLGGGLAAVTVVAGFTDVSTTAPTVATMVGIGVGIDYALLLVTRHVEGLRRGLGIREAAAEATATAGMSVLFAGATVLLSLVGLRFSGLKVFESYGTSTSLVVLFVVATAITLVPALCGLSGRRLLGRRALRLREQQEAKEPLTARWAARVGRKPLPWALAALMLLLLLAAPTLGMRTWPQDAGSQPESNTARQAYDLIGDEYGPGANGPLLVAVDLDRVSPAQLDTMVRDIAATPGVVHVDPPIVSGDGTAAIVNVESAFGPQDEEATDLVNHLRADVLPPGTDITGLTAVFVDIADLVSERLWVVIGVVVACSLVLLTVVFRSIVVPIKAAAVNLLSIGAAYGVLTAVFQWGWGVSLLGLDHSVPVSTWVPLLMFAVLFGLSMDYEVFLLSRVREDYQATGDAQGSVVRGLAATGRVITSAAAIMVAVFVGFAFDSDITVKMIGVGMAVAVALDATVVRLILVPAIMALMGKANWYLPRWLDRILPHIDVHGSTYDTSTEPPEPKELARV